MADDINAALGLTASPSDSPDLKGAESSNQYKIKRFGVWESAFTGAIFGAIGGFIFAIFIIPIFWVFLDFIAGTLGTKSDIHRGLSDIHRELSKFYFLFIFLSSICNSILSFIGTLIGTIIFNLIQKLIGGIPVELEEMKAYKEDVIKIPVHAVPIPVYAVPNQ